MHSFDTLFLKHHFTFRTAAWFVCAHPTSLREVPPWSAQTISCLTILSVIGFIITELCSNLDNLRQSERRHPLFTNLIPRVSTMFRLYLKAQEWHLCGRMQLYMGDPNKSKSLKVPVSCTHLDVYKRQKQNCLWTQQNFAINWNNVSEYWNLTVKQMFKK